MRKWLQVMCSWLPGFVGEMAPVIRFGKAKAAQARAWLLEVWREEGGCLHPFPGHHFPGVWCCFLPLHFGQPHLPQARSWGRLSSGASGCSPRSLSSAHGRPHHTPFFRGSPHLFPSCRSGCPFLGCLATLLPLRGAQASAFPMAQSYGLSPSHTLRLSGFIQSQL